MKQVNWPVYVVYVVGLFISTIFYVLADCGVCYAFNDNSIVCVSDMNNDGDIEQVEIDYCQNTAQGDLCPIEAQDCTVSGGAEFTCPDNTVLDDDSNKCVSNAGITCASGTYLPEQDLCVFNAVCSNGSVLNTATDKCEINPVLSCPSGTVLYKWNGTNICKKSPICPSGSTYNCSTKRCERAVSSYTCPSGTTLRKVGSSYRCYKDATLNFQCGTFLLSDTCSAWGYQMPDGSQLCTTIPPGSKVIGEKCGNKIGSRIFVVVAYGASTCPSGYTMSGDECYIAATPTCPSGYTRSGSVCYRAATCNSGYTYNANIPSSQCTGGGSCYTGSINSCLDGFTLSSGKCIKNPECSSSGSYNKQLDKCTIPTTTSCPSGTTYNASSGLCESNPSCSEGATYDPSKNVCVKKPQCTGGDTYNCTSAACERAVSYTCPTGTTLRKVGSSYRCYQDATTTEACSSLRACHLNGQPPAWGEYVEGSLGLCQSVPPEGFTQVGSSGCICVYIDMAGSVCLLTDYWAKKTCPGGYTKDGTECYIAATPSCPSGYTRSGSVCRKNPDCTVFGPGWQFDATITNAGCKGVCYAEGVQSICPYGDEYVCMDNPLTGTKQCSPNECFVFKVGTQDDDTEEGLNDKTDIGFEEDGSCVGEIYLFSGYDRRCREAGYDTSWVNCCSTSSKLHDICHTREQILADMRSGNQCHAIGSYCSKKVRLGGGCLQRVKTFCCFNSELGKIIQTQGRDLMKNSPSWGNSKYPNCVGLKPSEFEMLDFDSIDFSSMYDDITYPDTNNLRQEGENRINEFYQQYSN